MDEIIRYFLTEFAKTLTAVLYEKQMQWIDILLVFSDIV